MHSEICKFTYQAEIINKKQLKLYVAVLILWHFGPY